MPHACKVFSQAAPTNQHSEVEQDVVGGDAALQQNLRDLLAHLLLAAQHCARRRAVRKAAVPREHVLNSGRHDSW